MGVRAPQDLDREVVARHDVVEIYGFACEQLHGILFSDALAYRLESAVIHLNVLLSVFP